MVHNNQYLLTSYLFDYFLVCGPTFLQKYFRELSRSFTLLGPRPPLHLTKYNSHRVPSPKERDTQGGVRSFTGVRIKLPKSPAAREPLSVRGFLEPLSGDPEDTCLLNP